MGILDQLDELVNGQEQGGLLDRLDAAVNSPEARVWSRSMSSSHVTNRPPAMYRRGPRPGSTSRKPIVSVR